MAKSNPYVDLAKKAITTFLKTGRIIFPPDNLPKEMLTNKTGTFVSIHNQDDSLRGCIGTFLPTKKNVAEEIIANAIAAATEDPRFPPVIPSELPDLKISVDVLSEPKSVPNDFPLDPKKYGLIVFTPDGRRGLLLPDIPGVKTAGQQIHICCQKAGILPGEMVKYSIFTVKRHE